MDFNNIFRSFFGFSSPPNGNDEEFPEEGGTYGFFGPGFNHPGNGAQDWDEDDDANDDMFRGRGGFGWGGHADGGVFDFEREAQEMFQHFEEMFRNFGLSEFHTFDVPSIETTPNRRISPRDEMLKQPDEQQDRVKGHSNEPTKRRGHQRESSDKERPVRFGDVFRSPWHWNIPALPSPSQQGDKDLDEQVKDGRLDEILTPRQPQPHVRSFSKSVSIQTVRKPDGTVERRRTETDSDGKVTTTVTTSQDGDHSPVLIHPAKPRWGTWPIYPNPNKGDSQRRSLFDKFFGSWNR